MVGGTVHQHHLKKCEPSVYIGHAGVMVQSGIIG